MTGMFLDQRGKKMAPFLVAAPFALLAVWNLWTGYSYWLDEAYSVSTSLATWPDLFWVWLLPDTHPPLYQVILKLWIGVFGPGEFATRMMSAIAALVTLAVVSVHASRRGGIVLLATVCFLGSATTFAYYAQETRSYALLMMLGAIVTVQSLDRLGQSQRTTAARDLCLVLLSLTHYFGLIYAGVLLLVDVVLGNWRDRLRAMAVGAILLVWPVFHLLEGDLLGRAGKLWFPHESVLTTIAAYMAGISQSAVSVIEKSGDAGGPLVALLLGGLAAAIVAVGLWRAIRDRDREAAYLAAVIALFVGLLCVTDYIKPLSWPRNYIVVLPATALLFGCVAAALARLRDAGWWRIAIVSAVVIFAVGSTAHSVVGMTRRWMPQENTKAVIEALDREKLCDPRCDVVSSGGFVSFRTYAGILGSGSAFGLLQPNGTRGAEDRLVPVVIWNWPFVPAAVAETDADWHCWQPPQAWSNMAAVFVPDARPVEGFERCSPFEAAPEQ